MAELVFGGLVEVQPDRLEFPDGQLWDIRDDDSRTFRWTSDDESFGTDSGENVGIGLDGHKTLGGGYKNDIAWSQEIGESHGATDAYNTTPIRRTFWDEARTLKGWFIEAPTNPIVGPNRASWGRLEYTTVPPGNDPRTADEDWLMADDYFFPADANNSIALWRPLEVEGVYGVRIRSNTGGDFQGGARMTLWYQRDEPTPVGLQWRDSLGNEVRGKNGQRRYRDASSGDELVETYRLINTSTDHRALDVMMYYEVTDKWIDASQAPTIDLSIDGGSNWLGTDTYGPFDLRPGETIDFTIRSEYDTSNLWFLGRRSLRAVTAEWRESGDIRFDKALVPIVGAASIPTPTVSTNAVEFRSSSAAQFLNSGTGNKNITKPAGVQEGDLLIFFAITRNSTVNSPPTGGNWTEQFSHGVLTSSFTSIGSTNEEAWLWAKIAGASEPASYDLSINDDGTDAAVLIMAAFENGTGIFVDEVAATTVSPDVTADSNSSMLASIHATAFDNAAVTEPAGMDLREDEAETINDVEAALATEKITAAGATGTRTWTGHNDYELTASIVIERDVSFVDSFTTDTRSDYTITGTAAGWTAGQLDISTGDNLSTSIVRDMARSLGTSCTGYVDLTYGNEWDFGDQYLFTIREDANNYITVRLSDSYYGNRYERYSGGVLVENVDLSAGTSEPPASGSFSFEWDLSSASADFGLTGGTLCSHTPTGWISKINEIQITFSQLGCSFTEWSASVQ